MMPTRAIRAALILAAVHMPPHPGPGLKVEIAHSDSREVSGTFVSYDNGVLFLVPEPGGFGSSTLGLYLDTLSSLTLLLGQNEAEEGSAIDQLLPTASIWDARTWQAVLTLMDTMARQGSWTKLIRWGRGLVEAAPGDRIAHALNLYIAEAFLGLELWEPLSQELSKLNEAVAPMAASSRLCWLNARLAAHASLEDEVLFWCSLPRLRLPAVEDAYTEQLNTLRPVGTDAD